MLQPPLSTNRRAENASRWTLLNDELINNIVLVLYLFLNRALSLQNKTCISGMFLYASKNSRTCENKIVDQR